MRTRETTRNDTRSFPRNIGLPGRAAVSSAMAGGVLGGGFLLAVLTMLERTSGHAILVTLVPLFVVGAVYGFLQGGVVGYLGRPEGMGSREALAAIGRAFLYSVIGLAVAFVVAGWIAMTFVALYTGRVPALAIAAAGWIAGAGMVGWASREGTRALAGVVTRARTRLFAHA